MVVPGPSLHTNRIYNMIPKIGAYQCGSANESREEEKSNKVIYLTKDINSVLTVCNFVRRNCFWRDKC